MASGRGGGRYQAWPTSATTAAAATAADTAATTAGASDRGDNGAAQDLGMSTTRSSRDSRRRLTKRVLSSQSPEEALESQRLFLDNLKLWDCLALIRCDVSLSCQSAINLIFGLSNSEYLRAFPDALQSLHDRFPGGAVRYSDTEEAEMEDTRLREENIRLHAAVWVLRDNHGLQADSTLAAIFRLEEAKFKEKFPFDYESGGVGSLCSTGCPDYRNNNKTDKRTKRCHERPPVQLSKESGNKAVTSTSGSRRSRSASAKQYTGYKTSQPLLLHQRRSNSMWGREDFTSNRTPSSPSWHRPLSTPDPPKKRGEARTACEPIARRFVQEGWASSCDNPKEGGSFKMLKRSPSAAGRIEGQSCADGCEFTSRQNPAWLKAMNELQHCSAKLGLEINGPHKGRWGSRSRVAKCVSFAEPLTDSHRHRQSSLDDIYCRPDQTSDVLQTRRHPYDGGHSCSRRGSSSGHPGSPLHNWPAVGDDLYCPNLGPLCRHPPRRTLFPTTDRNSGTKVKEDSNLTVSLLLEEGVPAAKKSTPKYLQLQIPVKLNPEAKLNKSCNRSEEEETEQQQQEQQQQQQKRQKQQQKQQQKQKQQQQQQQQEQHQQQEQKNVSLKVSSICRRDQRVAEPKRTRPLSPKLTQFRAARERNLESLKRIMMEFNNQCSPAVEQNTPPTDGSGTSRTPDRDDRMCKRKLLLRGRGPSDFTSRKWQNQRMSSFRTRNADDKLAVVGYPFQFCLSLAPPPEIGDYEEDYGKPLIVLSTEPAVPTLGRPYSLSQYPTAKHFIGRHRFLQERYGDRTCTQPFLPFLVKEVSPEVDALRDVDHLRWLRNRRGWKPGRRQQRGERRPVPEKLSPLDGLELNMARPRDEKEEDEEALNSTGLGVPKVKAGAVLIEGKVKGCDHRRGCGRPVGFTLLRQIPRTKMTAPLAKMLKRKSTCHRWTPPHSSTKAAPRRGSQKGGGASDHDKDCEEERPPLLPVSLSRPSLLRKPYSPLVEEDEIGQA